MYVTVCHFLICHFPHSKSIYSQIWGQCGAGRGFWMGSADRFWHLLASHAFKIVFFLSMHGAIAFGICSLRSHFKSFFSRHAGRRSMLSKHYIRGNSGMVSFLDRLLNVKQMSFTGHLWGGDLVSSSKVAGSNLFSGGAFRSPPISIPTQVARFFRKNDQ